VSWNEFATICGCRRTDRPRRYGAGARATAGRRVAGRASRQPGQHLHARRSDDLDRRADDGGVQQPRPLRPVPRKRPTHPVRGTNGSNALRSSGEASQRSAAVRHSPTGQLCGSLSQRMGRGLRWRKTDSNHRSRRQRDGRGEGPAPNHRRRGGDLCLMTPSRLSVRHLRSATAERPFCKSGTDGSNPVSSSGESASALAFNTDTVDAITPRKPANRFPNTRSV